MTLRETEIELHFSVGSQEKPNVVSDAIKLYQLLKTDEYGPKFVSMTEVPDEGHVSLLPSLFSPMLRRVTS